MNKIPEYRVPKLLWEAFEATLQFAGKSYVKRLANILEIPEKELYREIFKTNSIPISIHEWSNDNFMCSAIEIVGQIQIPCRLAKSCGSEFCENHTNQLNVNKCVKNYEIVEKIGYEDMNEIGDIWLRKNGEVINENGQCIGFIKEDKLYLAENNNHLD